MNRDAVSTWLTIIKDVVLVAAVVFIGWKFVPLLISPALTSSFEISEVNLIVVKLRPAASERAVPAAPVVARLQSETKPQASGGEHPKSQPIAEPSKVKTFYAQQAQGSAQPLAVVVPRENVITPESQRSERDGEASGWSYVGTWRDGTYSDLTFAIDSGQPPAALASQRIRASTDVFIRDDHPRFLLGWTLGDRVGVLSEGTEVTVREVKEVPAKGGGSRVWVRMGAV